MDAFSSFFSFCSHESTEDIDDRVRSRPTERPCCDVSRLNLFFSQRNELQSVFRLAVHLLEKEAKEDQHGAKRLPNGDGIAEDQHGAEDGEKLSCGGENGAGQRTEPFNREEDEILCARRKGWCLAFPRPSHSLDLLHQSSRVEVSWA